MQQAHEADPDNKYVIDFEIKVAVAEERFVDAERMLEKFSLVEDISRVEHRRSTILLGKGDVDGAFTAAKLAVESHKYPQFEIISQYVTTAIRKRDFDAAQRGLALLSSRFKGIRADIQNGLWARYHLAHGDVDEALNFWSRINLKGTVVHKRIGLDVMQELLKNMSATDSRRADLEAEIRRLRD